MEKFVPLEKRSKKEQRAYHACRRSGWGALSPVTRRPENPKAYNRQKARNRKQWSSGSVPSVLFVS